MFDQLISRRSTRSKHVSAPFAEERSRYLEHCTERGAATSVGFPEIPCKPAYTARLPNASQEMIITSSAFLRLMADSS